MFEHPTMQKFFDIYILTLTLKMVVINYEALLKAITMPPIHPLVSELAPPDLVTFFYYC